MYTVRALVTGSDGFVGRRFVMWLKRNGYEVVEIDVKTGSDCRDFFKSSTESFDLVVHLAAIVGGRATIEGEPLAVGTDLSIDAEMFNWAVKTQQHRVVYFSSSAAYPIALQRLKDRNRLREDMINLDEIANPDETYGWAKLTGEMLARYARRHGVKVHVFRPFSGYGPEQDLNYPFPSFIDRVVRRVETFEIWGSGKQVRDFIHIDDVISGAMHAVELEIETPLNLGSGIATSFEDLAELVFRISGYRPSNGVVRLVDKPQGVEFRCSDPSQMRRVYQPKISLESGIEEAIDFARNRIQDLQ